MSTALQLPAPASSCSTRYCGKHPRERVVGVCSACLANKLSSLIYSSTAYAPEILGSSCVRAPLKNSPPPGSIDSPSNQHHPDQDRLQTIDEEAESSAQRFTAEGLLSSTLETSLTPVQGCGEAEFVGNNSVQSKLTEGQASLSHDEIYPIEEEKHSFNQDISLIDSLEAGKPKANPYLRANKPIKCKRSKSLCALRGDSLTKLDQEALALESASTIKGDRSVTGAKKVTLWTLFQLDDENKWRNRALLAPEAWESERCMHRFSADDKPTKEEIDGGLIRDSKMIEEAKGVHHDNHTHSHRCVPSASALSSSVCPSMPSKLKHSALLNSLLCRKTGDDKKGIGSLRKPSQVNDSSRADFIRSCHEGGLTQASNDGGFIRATYIASETRDQALRRCKSKLERSVARSSVSSSQPEESPPSLTHSVDMKSERKFNLSARALAAELPLILGSSAETAEPIAMIPCKAKNPSKASATQIEDCEEMLVRSQEEHHLVHNAAVLEWEIGDAMENIPFSVSGAIKAQDDEDVEYAEMRLSECLDANLPSISQARAADTMGMVAFMARANPEETYAGSFVADAAQEGTAAEIRDGIPTYITVVEERSQEGAAAMGCQSLSRSASFGKSIAGVAAAGAQQGTNKLAEEFKKGGGWEAYSSKSGKGVRRWPSSSSRTGKIAPAQSGLLRFYLTPLRASGRARFTATRRPPKRHFWPLMFI